MVRFEGPDRDSADYQSKFVRVGESISVTPPNDIMTRHIDLAENDDLLLELSHTKHHKPEEVDGGFLIIFNEEKGGMIQISGESTGLQLPTNPEARIKTGEIMKDLSEGYAISNELPDRLAKNRTQA